MVKERVIKESTASNLAYLIIGGSLVLLAVPFIYLFSVAYGSGIPTANAEIPSVEDLFKTIAAVVAGVIGSVGTYYFTSRSRA